MDYIPFPAMDNRRCVICQGVIPQYRVWANKRVMTCSPEHSKRHKQNLKNESARRLRRLRREGSK